MLLQDSLQNSKITFYKLMNIYPLLFASCIPFFIAFLLKRLEVVYAILLATMMVDLDHFANQSLESIGCSIIFILHQLLCCWYISFTIFLKSVEIGLFHMLTDFFDCMIMMRDCKPCLAAAPILLNYFNCL
jgi:hypothetical protein